MRATWEDPPPVADPPPPEPAGAPQYGIQLTGSPVRGPFPTEADARYWAEIMSRIAPSGSRLMASADGGQTWTEVSR